MLASLYFKESQLYCNASFIFQKKSLTDDLEQDEGFGTQSFRSSGQTDQEAYRSSGQTDYQSYRSSGHVDMADGADDYQEGEDSTQLDDDTEYFDVSFFSSFDDRKFEVLSLLGFVFPSGGCYSRYLRVI